MQIKSLGSQTPDEEKSCGGCLWKEGSGSRVYCLKPMNNPCCKPHLASKVFRFSPTLILKGCGIPDIMESQLVEGGSEAATSLKPRMAPHLRTSYL